MTALSTCPLALDYFTLLRMCLQWLPVTHQSFFFILIVGTIADVLTFLPFVTLLPAPSSPSFWPSAVCDLNYPLPHAAIFTFSFINFTYTCGSDQLFVVSSVICSLLHIHLRVLHRSRCGLSAPLDSFCTFLHLLCVHGG